MEAQQTRRGFLKSIAAAIGGLMIAGKADAKQAELPQRYQHSLPPGFILPFSGKAPAGWLECNGQSVSSRKYRELFNAIGTKFGGAKKTFQLPDLRGRVETPLAWWTPSMPGMPVSTNTYIIKVA